MLRSSSVGTARIGTTVPPRSTDPRLFQARATRPRPRSACATDDSEAARTRRAAAGTGTVVLFVVGRSPDSLDWNSPRRWCRTCSGMASFSPCWFPSACWDGCHSPSVLTGRHFTEGTVRLQSLTRSINAIHRYAARILTKWLRAGRACSGGAPKTNSAFPFSD